MDVRKIITAIVTSFVISFAPPTAVAQENNEDTSNRFAIERDGDGFVRMDRKTGDTSFCRRVNEQLMCELAVEERDVFYSEIADLQEKLATLQDKLDRQDQTQLRPKDDVPDTRLKDGAGSERDQFERELDRAMDITKQAVRKLFGAVKELQQEFSEGRNE